MERNKSFLDKIGSLIPGYKGYAEREIRRQNDKILRQKIVAELAVCEKIVQNRITKEIKNRNIEI